MSNFDTARKALETSMGSTGSAMEEHAKWSESLEARLNKLSAAWQALSQSFLNSDFLKVTLESVIALVDGLTKLTDTLGTLGTISLGTGIFTLIKSGGLKTFIQSLLTLLKFTPDLDTFGSKVKHVGTSIGDAGRAAKMSMGGFSSWAAGISIAITAISLIVSAIKNAHEEASRVRQEAIQESDEFLNSLDSFEGAYIKYSGRTNLTAEEEAELETAIKGTVDALGDKSSALQGVVNSSNDYVASLEAITKAELKAAESAAKEKQKNAKLELESIAQGWTSLDGSELNVNLELGASSGDLAQSNELIRIAKEIGGDFYYQTSSGYRTKQHDYTLRLSGNDDADTILDYYYTLIEYRDRLLNLENFDTDKDIQSVYEGVNAAISKVSETVKIYESGLYDLAKAEYQIQNGIPKTTEAYVEMREAILGREDIARTDFNTRKNIASALDSEYGQYFDLSSVEVQARKFIGLIKGYGDGTKDGTNEIGTVETFLNMRTAVNNNECSVGDYLSQFDEINKITKNWSEEEKKEFNTSFGLDTDSIKAQYDEMRKYLFRKVPIEVDERTENEIENFLNSLTANELQAVVDLKTEIDWENTSAEDIRKQIEDQVKLNEALRFSTSIEVDKTALEALNTAFKESASAMGLSEESIDSLKAKYSDLEGYNPHTLFEKTANGVKVNREELAKLEEKYNDLTKTEVQEHLDTLVEEYNKCTKAIDGNIGSQEKLELISKREKYAQQIEELAEYQAQLEGVTGAYQRWIDAQNTPQEYEGYQSIATSREDIEDEISRGFLSSATKEYIDLLSGKDLVGGSIDDYYNAWKKLDEKIDSTGYSINDFFTVNEDGDITSTGIDRFFKGMQQDFKGSVAEFNKETGQWEYDFSQENLQKIQDEWGIGIEAIELLLEAAVAAGYNVDWGGIFDDLDIDTSNFESVEAMISLAEKAQEEFNKLKGVEDVEFNFRTNTIEEATTEVEKARKAYLDLITNDDGSINLKAEGAEQMQFILATLLTQKQQLSTPAIMKVDTSQIDKAKTDVIDVVNKAKELQTAYENYEIAITTGVDVESAKADLNSAIEGMKGTSVDVRADLKLPTNEELTNAANGVGSIKVGATLDGTSIGAIATKIQTECTPEVIAKVTGLDETAIQNGSQQVVYTAEHSDVDNFINGLTDISKKIIYTYETSNNKPNPSNIERTITYKYETEGDVPEVNGTANVNGTAQSGRAFARGNWGIKGSGTALVGELGMETLVRGSRFYTIGDNGAEFIKYKQGDIIFNHKQTEELFKNGKVTSDGGRGRMFANGSAFAEGTALWQASASGSKFATNRLIKTGGGSSKKTKKDNSEKKNVSVNTTVAEDKNATSVKTDVNYNANVSESDFAKENQENQNKGGKGKEKFEETWDWIAIAIERIEREIDNLDKKVNNTYKSWGDRNTALSQEIAEVGKEIALQNDAADEYWNRAGKSLDHNSTYAKQIQNGTLNIEDFEGEGDEALVEKIKEYQKW